MAIEEYYYPDGECLDFFAIRGWKIAGMDGWGLNSEP